MSITITILLEVNIDSGLALSKVRPHFAQCYYEQRVLNVNLTENPRATGIENYKVDCKGCQLFYKRRLGQSSASHAAFGRKYPLETRWNCGKTIISVLTKGSHWTAIPQVVSRVGRLYQSAKLRFSRLFPHSGGKVEPASGGSM